MKKGRPRSIRRRRGTIKRAKQTYSPKQRAAARARAHVRRRKRR